jgi:aspartyl-tRNA synthetase
MAFVDDGEVVRKEMEPLIKGLVKDFAGKKLLSEDIPRIPYQESMEKYGSDKPDLRYGMELIELTDELKNTEFSVFAKAECVKAICVKGGADLSRKQIDGFTEEARKLGAGGLAYLTYTKEGIKSPIAKFMSEKELDAITKKTGAKAGDAVFFGADKRAKVNKVLGQLRISFANHFGLKDPNVVALCWIIDFPFYEWDEKNKKLDFGHNPFSMPKGGLEALRAAKTDEERLEIVADQYDMVANGYEICSGAVRNHNPEVMYEVFGILGYDKKYVESRFGGMLNAFKFGAPPHAGCAYGIDRLFMELENFDNIREIVAFPKNGSGMDLMMDSPSNVDDYQLEELHIEVSKDIELE